MVCSVAVGLRENFLRKPTIIIYFIIIIIIIYLFILLFIFKMTGQITLRAELLFVFLMEKGERRITSIQVSGKLPTYPSPKPSFCPKWEKYVLMLA